MPDSLLSEYTWEELDRQHQQSEIGLYHSFLYADWDLYEKMEESEEKFRYEKIRRMVER